MKSVTLSWTKSEKSLDKINNDLNKILSQHDFKIATHNQSTVKGRMIITLCLDEKPGKVRARCFKDQFYKNLDTRINEFISKRKVKFITQSYIGSTIFTVIYYEATAEEIAAESYSDTIEVEIPETDDQDETEEIES